MNKTIKELAEEVGFDLYSEDKERMFQEFAELIVRECLDIVSAGGEFCSRPKLVEKISQHFGVE